jgi:hypothetical protein
MTEPGPHRRPGAAQRRKTVRTTLGRRDADLQPRRAALPRLALTITGASKVQPTTF